MDRRTLVSWFVCLLASTCLLGTFAVASESTTAKPSSSNTATQQRSSSAAASLIGALGSLMPNLISNVAPLVLLFGIGALMMPALGMGLMRESRRSSNEQPFQGASQFNAAFESYARPIQTKPQDFYYFTKRSFPSLMSNINSAALMQGFQEVLDRVVRAIDNADKQYN